MCWTTERKSSTIPHSTSIPPALLVTSKAFIPEFFVDREKGQAGPQNGLRVRKSDFDWRKRWVKQPLKQSHYRLDSYLYSGLRDRADLSLVIDLSSRC